jgi:hypothetical protein
MSASVMLRLFGEVVVGMVAVGVLYYMFVQRSDRRRVCFFFCCQDVVPREFRYCSFSRSRNISVRCARDVIYLIDIASISDQLS